MNILVVSTMEEQPILMFCLSFRLQEKSGQKKKANSTTDMKFRYDLLYIKEEKNEYYQTTKESKFHSHKSIRNTFHE